MRAIFLGYRIDVRNILPRRVARCPVACGWNWLAHKLSRRGRIRSQRSRVVDKSGRLGEDSLSHECSRYGDGIVTGRKIPGPLIAKSEEGLISTVIDVGQHHGTADKPAKLVKAMGEGVMIAPGKRILAASLGKVIGRIKGVIAQKLVNVSMQFVGPGLGHDVENAAAGVAVLRRRIGCHNFELAQYLQSGCNRRLALTADYDRNSIETTLFDPPTPPFVSKLFVAAATTAPRTVLRPWPNEFPGAMPGVKAASP